MDRRRTCYCDLRNGVRQRTLSYIKCIRDEGLELLGCLHVPYSDEAVGTDGGGLADLDLGDALHWSIAVDGLHLSDLPARQKLHHDNGIFGCCICSAAGFVSEWSADSALYFVKSAASGKYILEERCVSIWRSGYLI